MNQPSASYSNYNNRKRSSVEDVGGNTESHDSRKSYSRDNNYYRGGMSVGASSRGGFARGGFLGNTRVSRESSHENGNFELRDRYENYDGSLATGLEVTKDLPPLKKDFYAEAPEISSMTAEQVAAFRKEHQMIMVGKDIPKPISSFKQAGFPYSIEKRIEEQKFDKPTPIQAQGWPMALSGRNMVGIAQTGSGKTLSYILPALVHITAQTPLRPNDGPIALVLAPTRELAYQIQEVARIFGSVVRVRNACVYGGAPKGPQIRTLRQGAEIVIATPGRLIDLLNMGCTSLSRVSYLVLDEADRMLDMGFEPQLREILPKIRSDRQVLLWSATWPKGVQRLARDLLGNDFIQVTIGSTDLTANKKIRQTVTVCEEADKEKLLAELLLKLWNEIESEESQRQMFRTIIFSNKKRVCEDLTWKLRKEQWPAVALHGDKSQQERDAALNDFKRGHTPILVSTDVAARGLDVKDVRVVINFDFPAACEDYVHRIGRTARGSTAEGRAFAFFTRENKGVAKDLVNLLREAEQVVPQQLQDMVPFRPSSQGASRFGGRGGNRYGRGGYGGNNRYRPY